MADSPSILLRYNGVCPDCAGREAQLPPPLPAIGDDFDWNARDYDGIRLFMMQELAARFPERKRWTPADLEVVIVEVFAAVLDRLADMADRVHGEAFLQTARREDSVFRHLSALGFDPVLNALEEGVLPATDGPLTAAEEAAMAKHLLAQWRDFPHLMARARKLGPRRIQDNRRMVTLSDYAAGLEDHPLVERAYADSRWTGSGYGIRIAVIAFEGKKLDESFGELRAGRAEQVRRFHRGRNLYLKEHGPYTLRALLRPYIDAYRMVNSEVYLTDAQPVGIGLSFSIRVDARYFQSEVRHAVVESLGTGPRGFFRPGRLKFGEDLHVGDLMQNLMGLEGVDHVCLNRFKRLGDIYPDQAAAGVIPLDGLEIAVCDNNPAKPERGYYRLVLHGGRKG